MTAPTGCVWAQKQNDPNNQPTNFAATQAGIQAALDFAGVGGHVHCEAANYANVTNLTIYAKCTLSGAGPLATTFTRASGATGTFLREKTAGEGNASGASGIVLRDFGVFGNSVGNGIDMGNQGGATFTSNAYISDVLVRDFTAGFGYKIQANAVHFRDMWSANCQTGTWIIGGGASHFSGLWAEQASGTHLLVDNSPWNTFDHVQIEQSGGVPTGPLIDLTNGGSDRNCFFGIYLKLGNNLTNLIICRTGIVNTTICGVRIVPGANTWTNTIYTEGTATGTGNVDWIGFFNDMSSSGKHFFNDQTGGVVSSFTGAVPTFPTANITTANLTTANITGTITQGVAGVGNSAVFGQGTTGADSSTIRARSGTAGIAQLLLNQNNVDLTGLRYSAGGSFMDYSGIFAFRSGGIGGTTAWSLGSGGAIIPKDDVTLTDAATIAIDASLGSYFKVTLTANRAMGTPTNASTGQLATFRIIQDGAGAHTLTWAAAFKVSWSDTGNAAGKFSTISFKYDGTNWNQQGAQSPYI